MLDNIRLFDENKRFVSEISVALFLLHPIVEVNKFRDLAVGDNRHYDNFSLKKKKRIQTALDDQYPDGVNVDTSAPVENGGFTLESYSDGYSDFVLDAHFSESSNVISLHNLTYKNWAEFRKRFSDDYTRMSKIQTGIYIKYVGLSSVTRFLLASDKNGDGQPIATEDIFNTSGLIPNYINDSMKLWDFKLAFLKEFSCEFGAISGNTTLQEDVTIGKSIANNEDSFLFSIMHSLIYTLPEVKELTGDLIDSGVCNVIDKLHENDVEFLNSCFTKPMCQKLEIHTL